jgi:hypothetical protein
MLRYGLRYSVGLAVCTGAVCGAQQGGALAWSTSVSPASSPVLVVAAKDANSSIAVAKTKTTAHQTRAPASEPIPPVPEKKDDKNAKAPAAKDAAPTPAAWKPEEIAAAQARCTAILKDLDAVSTPVPPIREGECGAAAPIRLTSLGKNPALTFSPPALVDCELAGALAGWIKNDVQPLAMKHLGAKIVRVEVMSDYACRTSAGRGAKHLSEHAFANAIDIGSFVTEKGQTASVLGGWGTPKREIAERIAAEKAKAEKETQGLAAADAKAQENLKDPAAKPGDKKAVPVAVASSLGTPAAGGAKRTRSNGVDKITITLPGASAAANDEITKLGGPKATGARKADPTQPGPTIEVAAVSIVEKPPGPQSQFLHAAHAAACRIFGTTLGPEANADHRNHFHVDMAERKYKKICD